MGGSSSKQIEHFKSPHNDRLSDIPSDWSELPTDILLLISSKLFGLYDVIHFRTVCKNWYTAVSVPVSFPRPPWIFLDDDCIPKNLTFSSLDNFDFCTDIPKLEGMQLVGTTYHYMVLLDETKNAMFLVNPITRKINPLPPFSGNYPRAHHIGVDPVWGENTVVIRLKLSDKLILLLCKPGDREWKIVPVSYQLDFGCGYHNGMYYINKGTTWVVELNDGDLVGTIPPPLEMPVEQRFGYLIESSGELLGIWKNKLWCSSAKEYHFEIFRLANDQQDYGKWIRMNNIGDRIMFLNNSTGFCFIAADFPGLKANCIYFISAKCLPGPVGPSEESFNVCRYNLKTGKTEELKSIDSILAYWFFPSLK